jgi:Clr5 domain
MEAYTKHIPPSEWDRHREAIVRLRRSGIILEGEEGIMAIMKRDHGFEAR